MIAEVVCPYCDARYHADVAVNTRSTTDDEGNIYTVKRVVGVFKIDEFESNVIHRIESYIQEDTTIEYLEKVMSEEFNVCREHMPRLLDKIRDVYGLYSPDGKRLREIV